MLTTVHDGRDATRLNACGVAYMIIIKIASPTKNDREKTGGGGQVAYVARPLVIPEGLGLLVEEKPDGCRDKCFINLFPRHTMFEPRFKSTLRFGTTSRPTRGTEARRMQGTSV